MTMKVKVTLGDFISIGNIADDQFNNSALGHRKSRYDNSIPPPRNSQMIPFHSEVDDSESIPEEEEEPKSKEKRVTLHPES